MRPSFPRSTKGVTPRACACFGWRLQFATSSVGTRLVAWLRPTARAIGDQPQDSPVRTRLSTTEHVVEVLESAGLPTRFAEALDDNSWDPLLDEETELALSRTGRDVGTPIITFNSHAGSGNSHAGSGRLRGISFFGPVISRVPTDEEALPLWDAVTTLASFPGFAEMKRSLREVPQLSILGFDIDGSEINEPGEGEGHESGQGQGSGQESDQGPIEEDWVGGHRRGHLKADTADKAD